MKKKTWILTAVGLAALLILSVVLYRVLTNRVVKRAETSGEAAVVTNAASGETADNAQSGLEPAPDFTVTDAKGAAVSLSQMRGKPVIVNIWATWCPPCREELPDFNAAYQKYGDRITFMMVSVDEDPQTVPDFLTQEGYTFPVYYDSTEPYEGAAYAFLADAIPRTVLIDANGNIVKQYYGMLSTADLQDAIALLLE